MVFHPIYESMRSAGIPKGYNHSKQNSTLEACTTDPAQLQLMMHLLSSLHQEEQRQITSGGGDGTYAISTNML